MPSSDPALRRRRSRTSTCLALFLTGVFFVAGCHSSPQTTEAPSFQRKYGDFTYCPVQAARQSARHSCGPACLSSVLMYWDIEIRESQILEKYPTLEKRPYHLVELRSIAGAEGLKAYVISMGTQSHDEAEQQILKGRPLICAVRLPMTPYFLDSVPVVGPVCTSLAWALPPRRDHFVVVIGLKREEVLVMDPAHGFASLPWHRFERAWSRMKHACLLVSN